MLDFDLKLPDLFLNLHIESILTKGDTQMKQSRLTHIEIIENRGKSEMKKQRNADNERPYQCEKSDYGMGGYSWNKGMSNPITKLNHAHDSFEMQKITYTDKMDMNPQNTKYIEYQSVSIADGIKAPPRNSNLYDVINQIRDGNKGLKQKIERLNHLYVTDTTPSKKNYNTLKATLPVFMASGIFTGSKSTKALQQHSGNIILDFDHMQDAQEFKTKVSNDKYNLAVFTSPSGNGVKVICKVNPIPITPDEHKIAWKAVVAYFEKYGKVEEAADSNGKNVNRLCYLSYDPTIYYNPQSEPIPWNYTEYEKEKERKSLAKKELAERKACQEEANQQDEKTRTELKRRGYLLADQSTDALDEFLNTDIHTIIVSWGVGIYTGNNQYRHPESESGDRSFVIDGSILKPYSESAQKYNPNDDKTSPVNAHRYATNMRFGLDFKKRSDIRQVKIELSDMGYGTHPDDYDKYRKEFENIARKEGLLKPRTAEQKLSIDTEHQIESENINVLRVRNDNRFQKWIARTQDTDDKHILIISTGAGTGKTTLTILRLEKSIDVSPITELADAKYEKAIEEGKNAVRHRPRKYNRSASIGNNPHTQTLGLDGGETVPCVYPDHCNTLAQRGYDPITTFCNRCPRKDECEEYGYLSQYRNLAQHNQIYFAWNEGLLTDPHSRKYIRKLTENGDYVGVLDEVDPADLCPQRSYTNRLLEQIYEQYRDVDCEAAPFLRKFIRETATATNELEWTETVRELLKHHTPATLQEIDADLQRIPVKIKFAAASNPQKDLENRPVYKHIAHITYKDKTIPCAILTDPDDIAFLDTNKWILKNKRMPTLFNYTDEYPMLITLKTFIRLGFVSLQTLESINLLPQRLYGFASDLKSFVDSTESETPPAQRTESGWEFYLTPGLNMRRVVFISASGVVDMINELYKHTEIDIENLGGKPPEWKKRCKMVQVPTGRYTPSQSLIEKDENRQPTGLKTRAVEMLSIIEKVATTAPDKKILVIAPKAFTPNGALADQPVLKRIHDLQNVDMINHAHAEGVNTYEHHEISFVFGYEIPPPDLESIARRIYRKETLSFEREKTTITKGGVILKDIYRYKDPRVQRIHNKTCEAVIMQAITRQRQMLHENRTTYLLTSEPISGLPTTPILATLSDMHSCLETHGELDKLDTFIAEQAERTVAEIAEQENITKRTAYRRTAEKRKSERDELEQNISQKYDHKISQRQNAKMLGISLGKLQSILKKHGKN